MLKDVHRAEAAAAAYFMDSKVAAIAAVSEVRVADLYPEAAQAVWRKFREPESISETDAVLVHAIERGKLWLLIKPTKPASREATANPHTT